MSDSHLDPHLRAENVAPERTTPQGSQALGVEHGHEGRDVIFRPIFFWFGGLSLFMALTLIVLSVTQDLWTMGATREEALPSPLFAGERVPPEPRILPNPIDIPGPNPMIEVQQYPEALPREREAEIDAAAKLGLLNKESGQAQVPDDVLGQVAARYGAPGGTAETELKAPMPSDASGGMSDEDRLR